MRKNAELENKIKELESENEKLKTQTKGKNVMVNLVRVQGNRRGIGDYIFEKSDREDKKLIVKMPLDMAERIEKSEIKDCTFNMCIDFNFNNFMMLKEKHDNELIIITKKNKENKKSYIRKAFVTPV